MVPQYRQDSAKERGKITTKRRKETVKTRVQNDPESSKTLLSLLMQAIEHTDFYFGGYKLITDQSTLTLQKPIL
ncbi:hypothetical protein ACN38_g10475 [Penicillium nordicum]|uniref:Uncharacterized protein n=1 Tax=Penicillium nordicum TaxID=229535 RepID=A0A0M8NSS8_9EURO|nr:hypothetical protein ACN38_g10475 [Penicillium nordicum]